MMGKHGGVRCMDTHKKDHSKLEMSDVFLV